MCIKLAGKQQHVVSLSNANSSPLDPTCFTCTSVFVKTPLLCWHAGEFYLKLSSSLFVFLWVTPSTAKSINLLFCFFSIGHINEC